MTDDVPSAANFALTTIPACLRTAVVDAADIEAVVDGRTRLTFAELGALVDDFARAAVARGVCPGDRVAIWAPNSARWIVAAFGIMAAGGVLVPVNTRFRGEEACYALRKVRASMLVLQQNFLGVDYLGMVRGAAGGAGDPTVGPVPGLEHLHTVVTLDRSSDEAAADAPAADDGEAVLPYDTFLALAKEVSLSEIDRRIAALGPTDIADILFTSGTTGFPKGAMVTHYSNLRVDEAWSDMVGLRRGDRYLGINPFFHSFGYRAGVLACLIRRATMLPQATFDVAGALALIQDERITVFPGAPTVYTTILDHPDFADHDLSSVRLAVTGATVVPVKLLQRMRADLGFEVVITAYGLTETCGTVTVCPPDTDEHRLSTSCGKAIPGTEVAIVDVAGNTLPPGESGEILARGYNVMAGYFEDPEATAEVIDAQGWMHTGDIGWMDADGYLRITDRKKDMFVVGGFNVYPAEVERLILDHPAVVEVAVVGMPDERLGEVGHAFVVVRPGSELTADELREFCRGHMANYKVPRVLALVTGLPRNASGKVQKFRLHTDV
ncbi:fatty acid--CoA ligase family protein [Nakamurella silvestris]|nr:fatty acid--CoA ligase family protein [Nakamurella silvestris]